MTNKGDFSYILSTTALLLSVSACGGEGSSPTPPTSAPGTGTSQPASTPSPTADPGTSPGTSTPVVTPPSSSPTVDGQIDLFVTRSGHWRLIALPAQVDAAVYRMTLDENPTFVREFACRRIFTKEAGDSTALNLATVVLMGISTKVAQGSCRVVQNMEPVQPNGAWLREAVANGLIPAYRRERAWTTAPKLLSPDSKRGAYDPTSLGPIPGSTTAPSSNSNFVGVTSAQGGEYSASRGFLHDADARVLDAALHNEDSRIAAYWSEFTQYTFYSLAQPQGAAWSTVNHVTIDPQFPLSGDRPWETPIGVNPNTKTDSMTDVDGWSRNVAHLENTGFVHWLATEDPIAGLLVQRQAAYALGSRYENYRGGFESYKADTAYEGNSDEERGILNTLSALWKSKVVASAVQSVTGKMFWSADRARKQANEVIAFYDRTEAALMRNATPESNMSRYIGKLANVPFTFLGKETYEMADGTTPYYRQTSAFQSQQYGKEPLYLWTRAGNATVRGWFETYTRQHVWRAYFIGGTFGVDGPDSNKGSGYPIGPNDVMPSYSAVADLAKYVAGQSFKDPGSRDNFNGASIHTAMQQEGLLLLAKAAGLNVPFLDEALARIAENKTRTTSLRYRDLQMLKHMAAPE